MTNKQLELIMTIVREQLGDYFVEDLVEEIAGGIERGIQDNMDELSSYAKEAAE